MAYDNETYLQSLNQSSADVTRQVSNALSEIARQRGVFQQQAAQIPGAAGSAFDSSRATLTGDLSSLGVQALPSLASFFDEGKAAYGRASGLLHQGFDEQATQRQGTVQSLQQQLLSDIASKRSDYVAGRQSEDRQQGFQAQQAARDRAFQQNLQDQAARLQEAMLAAQAAEAQKQREWEAAQTALGRPGADHVQWYTGSTGGSRAPGAGAPLSGSFQAGQYNSPLSYDTAYYIASAAYGPAGALNFLQNNQRPGGYTDQQAQILRSAQQSSLMLSKGLL